MLQSMGDQDIGFYNFFGFNVACTLIAEVSRFKSTLLGECLNIIHGNSDWLLLGVYPQALYCFEGYKTRRNY